MDKHMARMGKIPMRELEKCTGMTRASITFYIKEGILPEPEKSAKNMAYYDGKFIERLKLVEEMKNAGFTLNQIKKLVASGYGKINDYGLQVVEAVNRQLSLDSEDTCVPLSQLKDIGFDDAEIDRFIEMKLIIPADAGKKMFPQHSLTVCRFFKYYKDVGMPVSVAETVLIKLRELVDIEKNAFVDYIRAPMIEKGISEEEQGEEVRKCVESISAMLPVLHLQLLKLPSEYMMKIEGSK